MFNPFTQLNGRKQLIFQLSVILVLSILAVLPMMLDGIPGSTDIPQQFQFAQTFYDLLKDGNFYTSWAAETNFGYGDVGVRFYPPLTYFLLSFFRLVSGNWFDASVLFVISGYFVSGVGIYLWSREWFPENASLAAGLTYIILPYHIQQIYIGALFAEFTATAILPFCFLFTYRVCQKNRWIDVWGLALTFGLLVITHLPTTIMASLALLVYVLFSLKKATVIQSLLKLSTGVTIGILLSSFYWVRLVSELDFVKHSNETYTSGYYSYKTEFVFSYLFPFVDIFHSSPTTLMSLVTILTLGILIPCSISYFREAKETRKYPITNVVAMTVFALMMATPLSLKIWEYFPLLQKIQYPFRWLTLFSMGAAVIMAAGFNGLAANLKTSKRYLAILAIGFLLICIPYNYFNLMTPVITYPKDYFLTVVDRFRISASCECWWTSWAKNDSGDNAKLTLPRPQSIADKVVLDDRKFEIKDWSPTNRTFVIESGSAGQASIATLYYPHWKAEVNGQAVQVTPSEIGLISFPVKAEKAEVKVYFEEPKSIITAYYLSASAWLLMAVFPLFYFGLRKTKTEAGDV